MRKSINIPTNMSQKELIWNKNLIKSFIKNDPNFAN